jgi:hypothetical protein
MKAGQKQTRLSTLHLVLALGVAFLISAVLQVMQPSTAMAATYSELSIAKRAEAWVMGRAVSECIDNVGFQREDNGASDMDDGHWMWSKVNGPDGSTDIGEWAADITEGKSDDSRANCRTAAIKTLQVIGISGTEFICKTNELAGKEIWKRDNGDCRNGTGDYDFDEDNNDLKSSEIWNIFFRDWLGGNVEASLTRGMRYVIYSENFYQECSEDHGKGWNTPREWKSSDKEDNESDGKVYKLNGLLQLGSTADKDWYVVSGGNGGNQDVHIDGYGMLTGDDVLKCSTLADRINDNSSEYLKEVAQSTNEEDKEDSEGGVVTTSPEETTSCDVDGIGWIVCPVVTFLSKLNDAAFSFLSRFLEVPPKVITDEATKTAWEAFRNIANIVFVIAFLAIIYSQMTGQGVSNYGIKKLLPKLVAAAILINLSYYICQILVDLSNIAGASLYDLIAGVNIGSSGGEGTSTWEAAGAVILGTGAIIGLLALIIFAPMSLLAFALIILILIARQALVILLVVLSPLAFAAFLLPNTEDMFKKWWKALTGILLVFPIIAVVFGASSLASKVLIEVGQSGADDDNLLVIIGAAVLAIPLFAVPTLLKGAMSASGTLGAKLSGLQNGANKMAGKNVKNSRLGAMKREFDRDRQIKRTQRWGGKGAKYDPRAFVNRGINRATGKFGERFQAAGAETQQKMLKEDVDRRISLMESNMTPESTIPDAQKALAVAIDKNDVVGARAATKILLGSGSKGKAKLTETLDEKASAENWKSDSVTYVRADMNAAGLKGSDRAADEWSRRDIDKDGFQTISQVASNPKTIEGLNDVELAGQSASRLSSAVASGGLTSERAQVVKDNKEVWASLAPDKRTVIEGAITGSGNTSTTSSSTPPAERELSSQAVRSMKPDNAGSFIQGKGGAQNVSDGDLITIRNAHGSSEVGQAARDELQRRGIVDNNPPKNLP